MSDEWMSGELGEESGERRVRRGEWGDDRRWPSR